MDQSCFWVERGARFGAGDVHVSDSGGEALLDAAGYIVCEVCNAKVGLQVNGIRYDVVRGRGGRWKYAASTLTLLNKVKK